VQTKGTRERERTFARRAFLRSAAAGTVAGTAAVATGLVPALLRAAPAGATDLSSFVSPDLDLHMLRRATYGLTTGSVSKIKQIGRNAWLDKQLAPDTIDDTACEQLIASRLPMANWTIAQAMNGLESSSWDAMFQLGVAAVARAAWSKRQLFEVMVDFWSNHLNVTNPSDSVWSTRPDYDRRVIRAHALGKFSDMLRASATHPAMMTYLNNAESTKDNPNQNYGRELLELHSVGVDGGYGETDMENSTNVMTGFGIDWDTYEFKYWKYDHYVGAVSVMDWSSPNGSATGGYDVGLAYVDHLAHHPSTAIRIATKLLLRFVSDVPDPAFVASLAQTYLDNDTAIAPVLRKLLRSGAFRASVGQKVRRPFEDLIATIRVLGIQPDTSGIDGLNGLYWMIDDLADAPMTWHMPNGFPDVADSWRSAGGAIGRWNMHMSLAAHWWPDSLVLPPLRDHLLPPTLPRTYGSFIQTLANNLVFSPLGTQHRDAVLGFLGKTATDPLHRTDEALRWRLPYVVALILDSPYHQTR